MSESKPKYHRSCTIVRTFKRTRETVNRVTGETLRVRSEMVTEPCGVPLFMAAETSTGVCRSCASGWSVPDNKFSSKAEKARAMAEGVSHAG